jgi:predicted AAA+ superfamily ATPase
MYQPRTIEKTLVKNNAHYPVLLVTGARQVGKTTLLKHLADDSREYISLDSPIELNQAQTDPAIFMQRHPGRILIDEIQYAPQLLPYIKMVADENKMPGQFWLTGSQQFHMMKNVTESLAGRVGISTLLGLSHRELIGQGHEHSVFRPSEQFFKGLDGNILTTPELYRLIWRGSFPVPAINEDVDRDGFLDNYVQTYLQRDVRDLTKVNNLLDFWRFLRACAARTGQLLNIAELSRDAHISPVTGKNWLSVLVASNIVYLLEPYFANVTKRLVKAPKLYFLDTGLAAYLTDWDSPKNLESGAMSGAIFETWVIGELLKSWRGNGLRPPFYYYRDKDQKEIDLLIVQNGQLFPLECKKTASPNKNDIRHFQVLDKLKMPVAIGGVICMAPRAMPLTAKAWIIPVGCI